MTRLYADTDTPVEAIAHQFGIGQTSVYRLAQQQGVPLRQAAAASVPNRARTPAGDRPGHQLRSGGVGHRFQVTFLAETVIEAADMQHAVRQVEALGATDITAITRVG